MAYADYQYYTNTYRGTAVGADAFPRLAQRASEHIDAATCHRARSAAGEAGEAVRRAACALAEVLQDEERLSARVYGEDRPVTSETVGGWSRSYASQSLSASETALLERRKRDALRLHLGPWGLLRMRGAAPCRD